MDEADRKKLLERSERNLQRVPGYGELAPTEKELIKVFAVLWPLFEERCCGRNANKNSLKAFSARVKAGDREVNDAFHYFFDRYKVGPDANNLFHVLCSGRMQDDENQGAEIKRCLQKVLVRTASPEDRLLAVLLVVYRLRNNLLHGNKYEQLARQTANFEHALSVLNWCVEKHGR